jgi:hypothetical protein
MGVKQTLFVLVLLGCACPTPGQAGQTPVQGAAARPTAVVSAAPAAQPAAALSARPKSPSPHEVKPHPATGSDRTQAEAESAGRSAAHWLKHAGKMAWGFLKGLKEGLAGQPAK